MARERIAHRETQYKEVQNRTLRKKKRSQNKPEDPTFDESKPEKVSPWGVATSQIIP